MFIITQNTSFPILPLYRDWAEEQLHSWKSYVDANPLHELKDRIEWKPTAKGGMLPMVIASIEAQGKFIQETMKNYLHFLKLCINADQVQDPNSYVH